MNGTTHLDVSYDAIGNVTYKSSVAATSWTRGLVGPLHMPQMVSGGSKEDKSEQEQSTEGEIEEVVVTANACSAGTLSNDDTAGPFIDDAGNPVLDMLGNQMQRPAGWDPHFFTHQGAVNGVRASLSNFRIGGAWDAQRMGGGYQGSAGTFHAKFVDFANVNIGLFSSSAGFSEEFVLSVANGFASIFSNFGSQARDPTYTHLRPANVYDIRLGFKLQKTGAICTPD